MNLFSLSEVPDAIARCQRAGVTVRMVTGEWMDHRLGHGTVSKLSIE